MLLLLQVKKFGRSGQTKYTHLLDQDTTRKGPDSVWITAERDRAHGVISGQKDSGRALSGTGNVEFMFMNKEQKREYLLQKQRQQEQEREAKVRKLREEEEKRRAELEGYNQEQQHHHQQQAQYF